VISGKPTVSKATPYAVTLKVSNAKGSSTATTTLKVHALPSSLMGTFNGLADRNIELSGPKMGGNLQGHGGRLSNLVISSTGSFTGTLQLEGESYSMPLGSRLDAVLNANASATVRLVRGTAGDIIPDLALHFTINKDTGKLTGTLGDGGVGTPLNLQGWRQTAPTTGRAGAYTAALDIQDQALVGDIAYPQGNGYLTLSVSAMGVVTWNGRLADGTAITGSSTVAANGDIPFHQLLYSASSAATAGSAHGWLKIRDDSSTPAANGGKALLDGTIDWLKKGQTASSATRSYKQGFPLHHLVVVGGRYTAPAAGQLLLGFVDGGAGTSNAILKFSEGGLTGPPPIIGSAMAANVGAVPVRITSINKVVMPTGAANPATVSLTITTSSGLMSGSFTLKNDPDPTDIAAPVALLTRKANYAGVLVPRLGMAMGHFQLAELPSLQGAVKTTLSTSPIWSGQVVFE
jgi:PKD repeat protein